MKNILLLFLFYSTIAFSQNSVVGQWKSIDDLTGESKSVVEIYKVGTKYFGKIVKVLREKDKNALCEKCKGNNYKKPVLGMIIIKDLVQDENNFKDGEILDPENGKTYDCKIWVDKNNNNLLNVRGYIGFLFRTQKWIRVK